MSCKKHEFNVGYNDRDSGEYHSIRVFAANEAAAKRYVRRSNLTVKDNRLVHSATNIHIIKRMVA